ncbi:MAG: FAD:protein FMN transferase [Marmoricola sp.]
MSTDVASAVHRETAEVMGTVASLALRGQHAGTATGRAAWDAAVAELREAEAVFSTWREDSWVSRLDRGDVALADCPPVVAEVLALGERARVESGGAFDVRRPGADGRVHLDPSGVVKGWATERAARHLAVLEDTDSCLSVGGDMVCRVVDPDRPAWRVGVEDPRTWERIVAVVPVRTGAVATSGLHRRGAHLTDARTGETPSGIASVTVVHHDLTWADIDATAAFAQGAGALDWLRGRPGRTGVVVWEDGRAEVCG